MILGVALGTSVVKAAAFSKGGEVLAVEGRRVKLYNPRPECSEQDIDETLEALGEVVRAVIQQTEEPIGAVGLTGQGDGPWLLDERGRQVRRTATRLDARANSIVEEWRASGVFEEHFRRNGNVTFPPSEDLADLYRKGFDRYLTTVEADRELWDKLRAGPPRP